MGNQELNLKIDDLGYIINARDLIERIQLLEYDFNSLEYLQTLLQNISNNNYGNKIRKIYTYPVGLHNHRPSERAAYKHQS